MARKREYNQDVDPKLTKELMIDGRRWVLWAKNADLISIALERNSNEETFCYVELLWDSISKKLLSSYRPVDEENKPRLEEIQTLLGNKFDEHKRLWEEGIEKLLAEIAAQR